MQKDKEVKIILGALELYFTQNITKHKQKTERIKKEVDIILNAFRF